VQDTLLRALQRAGSFHGEASLATGCNRILHNLAVDRFAENREDATKTSTRDRARWT